MTSLFPAERRSICEECGQVIEVGDAIAFAGDAGWVHWDCPQEPVLREVCSECFTEKSLSGGCLCS